VNRATKPLLPLLKKVASKKVKKVASKKVKKVASKINFK
jgi:hypothetical protein